MFSGTFSSILLSFLLSFSALAPVSSLLSAASPIDISLSSTRHAASDLEVAGSLAGLPDGTVRFASYQDLLKLPQVQYTISDDSNFAPRTKISGVSLDLLAHALGAAPEAEMLVAICTDKYRTNYPRSYIADHRPLLVLTLNDKAPEDWPLDSGGGALGPYLISHPAFTPSFKVLSHVDEKQVPTGVARIEFRREAQVFGAIRPRGVYPSNSPEMQGFRIAQQNCYRCHNMGAEGGQKAGRSWKILAAWASTEPDLFNSYVRNPQASNPGSKMEGSPHYDDATLSALRAYFTTFATEAR